MRARNRPAPSPAMDMEQIFESRSRADDTNEAMLAHVARAWVFAAGLLAAFGAVLVVVS